LIRWALVAVYWAGALMLAAGMYLLGGRAAVFVCLGAALMLYAVVGRVMMGFLP
jgi:hypothetical protein